MSDIRWTNLVLDVPAHAMPTALAAWEQITGCTASQPGTDAAQTRVMQPPSGASWLKVRTLAGDVPRVHLELLVDDVDAFSARAIALGAHEHSRGEGTVVLRCPSGVRFAVSPWHGEGAEGQQRDVDSLVDQVCLDLPSNRFRDGVEFWAALTGWAEEPGHYADMSALVRPHAMPVRITFQRVGSGEASCHPDVAARNPVQLRRQHEAMGAVFDEQRPRWTVMVGPSGMRYCITERDPITGLLA